MSTSPRPTTSRAKAFALASVSLAALAACSVNPEPLTRADRAAIAGDLRAELLANVEAPTHPISIDEAIARVIKHNFEYRLEALNTAVADAQLDLSHYDMLPKIAASAGYTARNNDLASFSQTTIAQIKSNEPAISSERRETDSQISITWNVMDFAVGFIRAKQTADKVLIAREQRRKVLQNLIQDTTYAYWRAVAADHLLARLGPTTAKTQLALARSHGIAAAAASDPLAALTYQKNLLTTLDRLKNLRRDLVTAKAQLASLMGLPPGIDYSLAAPAPRTPAAMTSTMLALENVALVSRPELAQGAYANRITAADRQRLIFDALPGIGPSLSGNTSSNKFLVNHMWFTAGISVAGSLMNLVSLPAKLDANRAEQDVGKVKQAALAMAIIAQVHIAALRYDQARDEFATAAEAAGVDSQIAKLTTTASAAGQGGDLAVIQADADDVFGQLRKDVTYSNVQNAQAALLVALGADPLPDTIADSSLTTIAAAVHNTLAQWQDGTALRTILLSAPVPWREPKPTIPSSPSSSPRPPSGTATDQPSPAPVTTSGGSSFSLSGGGRLIVGG